MCLLNSEPNFIEKIPLGKGFFQIFAEIEMTRNENTFFGRHFEMVQIFLLLLLLEYGCD